MERLPWLPRLERGGRHRAGIVATAAAAVLVAGVTVAVFVYPGVTAPSGLVRACAHLNGLRAVVESPSGEEALQWTESYAAAAESSGRAALAADATKLRIAALTAYTGGEATELARHVDELAAVCAGEGGEAAWAADFTPVWHCEGERCGRGPEFIAELLEDFDP